MTQSKQAIVIKVGGSFFDELGSLSVGDNSERNNKLLQTIADLQQNNQAVVLVHGGGQQVLERLSKLGLESVRKNGLRVTPDEHMPIVTSVLAGELNKQLVATCSAYGINAVGICLADGNIANCTEHPDNIGAVGEPSPNSPDLLNALINSNMVAIVASIGKDTSGRLYNVNADHAAICIAELLSTQLYFFADVPGVLDANKQNIAELSPQLCAQLIQNGVITDGMTVKVQAAQFAANRIQKPVTIASWAQAGEILIENKAFGTKILPK